MVLLTFGLGVLVGIALCIGAQKLEKRALFMDEYRSRRE